MKHLGAMAAPSITSLFQADLQAHHLVIGGYYGPFINTRKADPTKAAKRRAQRTARKITRRGA